MLQDGLLLRNNNSQITSFLLFSYVCIHYVTLLSDKIFRCKNAIWKIGTSFVAKLCSQFKCKDNTTYLSLNCIMWSALGLSLLAML